MNDSSSLSQTIVAWMATYLLHSTLLLTLCWLLLTLSRSKSHYLAERMWKLASVLGVVTALAQTIHGSTPVLQFAVPSIERLMIFNEPTETNPQIPVAVFSVEFVADRVEHVGLETAAVPASDQTDVRQDYEPQFAAGDAEFEPAGTLTEAHRPPFDLAAEISAAQVSSPAVSFAAGAVMTQQPNAAGGVGRNLLLHAVSWMLAVGFVAGSVLLGVQSLRIHLRLGRLAHLQSGPIRRALNHFLKRHNIRADIRLLYSLEHSEPFAYGLFRWTIVLPEGIEDRLERNELKALLAHEVAHLVRGDVRWLWVGRMLCTCCAFQPLNFLARRRWQRAAEYLCDDWAVERGVPSLSLAGCLTRVAEWRLRTETPEIGLAAGGSKTTLVQRVERLVADQPAQDAWQCPWRRRLLAIIAPLIAAALVVFAPRVVLPKTPVMEPASVANVESIETADLVSISDDWHAVEEELLRLDADLRRVDELADALPSAELAGHFQNLNRRAAKLRTRRDLITSLLEKESQR